MNNVTQVRFWEDK